MEEGQRRRHASTRGGSRCSGACSSAKPSSPSEEAAYGKWLDQTSDREQARQDRLHGAEGIVPVSIWLVLVLIAGVVFAYMLFFADSGEGAVSQAMLIGSATTVIVLTLIAIEALDNPYRPGLGQIQPVAMERSLRLLDEAREARRRHGTACRATPPALGCDGAPARDRGDGAARGGGRRDRVGELPVGALAQRAGEGRGQVDRGARRVDARGRRGEPPGSDRRRPVHAVGGRVPARRGRARGLLSSSASAPSFARRSTPGSRPGRGSTPTRRCRRSRCPSTSSRRPRRPTGSRRGPARSHWTSGASSSAPTTTRSPSCCSPSRCSSPGISTRLHSTTPRMVVLGLGYALFLGGVIWIATFPVSVSV